MTEVATYSAYTRRCSQCFMPIVPMTNGSGSLCDACHRQYGAIDAGVSHAPFRSSRDIPWKIVLFGVLMFLEIAVRACR